MSEAWRGCGEGQLLCGAFAPWVPCFDLLGAAIGRACAPRQALAAPGAPLCATTPTALQHAC